MGNFLRIGSYISWCEFDPASTTTSPSTRGGVRQIRVGHLHVIRIVIAFSYALLRPWGGATHPSAHC